MGDPCESWTSEDSLRSLQFNNTFHPMSNPALKHLLEMKSTNEAEQLRLSLEKGKLEGKEEQLISRGDSHSPVNNQVRVISR